MEGDDLGRTRVVTGALGAAPLLVTALLVVGLADAPRSIPALSSLSALLGLLSAPVAWRVYGLQRDRIAAAAGTAERERAFFGARVVPVSITEGFALLGGVSYALTREPWALAGIVTHVFLVGAVWPREAAREELEGPDSIAVDGRPS